MIKLQPLLCEKYKYGYRCQPTLYLEYVWLENNCSFFPTQLAVWPRASQRRASCHSSHPRLLPVNSDPRPLYSQIQYCHDIWPSTDNSMNEEGEGGRLGGYTAVHIVYPHKDLFKHLSENKCRCVSGWTKRCVPYSLQYSLLRTCVENLSHLCKTTVMFKFLILYLCSWLTALRSKT